ncbi:MAG: alpha/beta hydrolase [Boseongicola sp. SB0670_bin_30]|nr:alpha/beta hydrolase [Boseongicola sp. SB0670_bin_30]
MAALTSRPWNDTSRRQSPARSNPAPSRSLRAKPTRPDGMPGDYDLPGDTPGFAEAQAEMSTRSREAVTLPGAQFDVAYGPLPRQRLDVFPAGTDAPAHLFFRGGYWKLGEKEDRRFPATAWVAQGAAWIVPNYRLAPATSLPDILEDALAAFDWVISNAEACGIDRTQIHLSGNSAGAQLAAMVAARAQPGRVASLTLISGLYDLLPLLDEEPNSWLNLDVETARAMSPVHHLPSPELPVVVTCGGAETEAFRSQARQFAETLKASGNPVDHFESPGQNHMEIIIEIGTPGTPVFAALERQLEERRNRLECQ